MNTLSRLFLFWPAVRAVISSARIRLTARSAVFSLTEVSTAQRTVVTVVPRAVATFGWSALLLAVLLTTGRAAAQDAPPTGPPIGSRKAQRLEKIESARAAFLTTRLNLTTEQAQKFWPLYNDFDTRRRAIRQRAAGFRPRRLELLADNQLQGALDAMLAARQDELNLEREVLGKFQKVISLRQIAALYSGEREFTKLLLRRLDERRSGQEPGRSAQPADDDLPAAD